MWRKITSSNFLLKCKVKYSEIKIPKRNISMLVGVTSLSTFAIPFQTSSCEAHISHGFSENIPDHPRTIPVHIEKDFSFLDYIKKTAQWIIDFFKLLTRLGYLTCYFTPAVVTSPLLLTGSSNFEKKWWELIRYAIFCSGPCLTKFAQWIATRPDIFPQRFCKELELLQTRTYQHKWEDTVKTLDLIYGPNWRKYLILDHDTVAGSGLMAQVYHGYIHTNNPNQHDIEIALKILHPGVEDAIKEDLILINFVTHSLQNTVDWLTYLYYTILDPFSTNTDKNRDSIFNTTFSLSDTVSEFQGLMLSQINFKKEADSMIRFKHNFSKKKWINRVKFAEPINLLYYLQTGQYYPNSHISEFNTPTESLLEFPLKYDCDSNGSGVLIQTFEHGIPMATYLTESKNEKETLYTNNKEIETNKHKNHREHLTINGLPSVLHQAMEQKLSFSSSSSSNDSIPDEKIHELHLNRDKEIAALGLDIILKMLFEDNFIHGDLHPGNLLISYDKSSSTNVFSLSKQSLQLVVLDTGICTELNAEDRKNLIILFKAVVEGDGLTVARLMMNKSRDRNPNQQIIDPIGFENSMKDLISETFSHGGLKLANNGVTKLLNEVLLLCYKHRVRLESGFSSIMLSIGIVEGLGVQLDPDVDVISRAVPFIVKSAAKDLGLL